MDTVSLTFECDKDTVETTSAEFDHPELDLLSEYVQFVDRVFDTALLRRGMPAITNMSWDASDGVMKWACPPYKNSELHELLHVLRPLILVKEATSFERICGLLGKKFDNETFRGYLKTQRTVFKDGELKLYMQISLNNQPLFEDSTLQLWLNGEQYHTDKEKAAIWKDIENSLTEENARALVISQLNSKVKALANLQHIAKLVLERVDA